MERSAYMGWGNLQPTHGAVTCLSPTKAKSFTSVGGTKGSFPETNSADMPEQLYSSCSALITRFLRSLRTQPTSSKQLSLCLVLKHQRTRAQECTSSWLYKMGRNVTPGPDLALCLRLDQNHAPVLFLQNYKTDISSLVYNTSARFTKINGRSSLGLEVVRGGKACMPFERSWISFFMDSIYILSEKHPLIIHRGYKWIWLKTNKQNDRNGERA